MKFILVATTLLAVVSAVASPGPAAALEAREAAAAPEPFELVARACKTSNCACNKVQGQFCGNEAVNKACTNGHVFECNGNTGKTCDYGVRDSCQKCGKLKC